MQHRTIRGFTLIELLVVIGIVFLLAGMLFPVLMKARAVGQRTVCLSNIRQLAAAFTMYIGDHDEQFPCNGDQFLWMGRAWRPLIEPYTGTRKIFWCPADAEATYKYDSTSYAYMQTFYHRPEDIISTNKKGYFTCATTPVPQSMAGVTCPERKILLYEWTSNHDSVKDTMWGPVGAHMAAFVDGHAALLHQEDLHDSALGPGNKDPNWTVGGIGGKDIE